MIHYLFEYASNITTIYFIFNVSITRNLTTSFSVAWPDIQTSPCSPRCTHARRSVVLVLVNTLRFPTWLPCMWYQNCKHTVSFGSSQSLKISAFSPCRRWDASMKRNIPGNYIAQRQSLKGLCLWIFTSISIQLWFVI